METMTQKDVLLSILSALYDKLDDYEVGSDDYNRIMTEIHKTSSDLTEIEKNQVEAEKIYAQQESAKKDRWVKINEVNGRFVLIGTLAVLACYFEKEHSFASSVGRRLFGNLIPKI